MSTEPGILGRVRAASAERRLYLPHALRQMARPDRMITTDEVRAVVERGDLVEDYPADLAIITAYLPDGREWTGGFRVRRSR